MPVGGCVLFAVASLVSFFSFVFRCFLSIHDPDSAGRRRAVACEAPSCGPCSELGVRPVFPQRPKPQTEAPVAPPGTHERLLTAGRIQWDRSLSDRIANSDPFRDRRILYQRLSGLTRGKIHFFWGAYSGRAARKGFHFPVGGPGPPGPPRPPGNGKPCCRTWPLARAKPASLSLARSTSQAQSRRSRWSRRSR